MDRQSPAAAAGGPSRSLALYGDQKVLYACAARLQHCLYNDAFRRGAVGIDHDPWVGAIEHRLQREGHRREVGRGFVNENLAVLGDGKRDGFLVLEVLRVALREVYRDRVEALHRQGGQHERYEQKEHHVDHRYDLDAAVTIPARSLKLHSATLPLPAS